MKKTNIGIWAITLIIAGLMISVSAVATMQKPSDEEQKIHVTKIDNCAIPMDISVAKTLEPIHKENVGTLTAQPLFQGYTPTVASDLSNVCLGFQDDETVWFTGSTAGGATWAEDAIGYQIPDIPEFPDVDSCGDGRFIGGMVPNYMDYEGGALYKWAISDVADLSDVGYSLTYWTFNDLGDGYTDFRDVGVGGYTADDPTENTWAYGVTTMQGDVGGVGPQPLMSYQFTEDGYAWIYTFGGVFQGGEITSADIDPETLYMYGVWNFYNETSGVMDVLIEIMDFGTWDEYEGYPIHPEIGGYVFSTLGSDDYLDISAQSDNVIIVSERDGQIVAYTTADGFTSTLEEIVIAVSGKTPRIVHMGDNKASCVFIDGGELYMSTTEDGGITWDTPIKQSDSEGAIIGDIGGLGYAYEGNDGVIYYGHGGIDFPVIGIGSISGGFGITVKVTNTGTGDAVDVPYTISATGGLLGMVNSGVDGTISVAAGASETISLPMIIGLGKITIEVTAGSASETVQGTQIIVYTLL